MTLHRSAPPPVHPLSGLKLTSDVPFDPSYGSIERLRQALDAGELTSENLVRFYLDRVRCLDKDGPRINAIINLNPKALDQARSNDDRRRSAKILSLLDGIPFVAKDNFDTAGIPTTGGSAVLISNIPVSNAVVVQTLIDRGAILLGKTNMSELAASHGRFGYSSAGGQTVNPFNTAHHVSGSSSGSAAAVAADYAPFALGTDTSGSIRAPASVAGLAGLRPTTGLISRGGVIPMSLTTDTPGPLARTVRDLAIVLDVIAHPDPDDVTTLGVQRQSGSYTDGLDGRSLDGVRLGVVTNFRGFNAEIDAVEQTTLRRMQSNGAILVPLRLPTIYEAVWHSVLEPLGRTEFKTQINRYLSKLPPSLPRSLKQIIDTSLSPAISESATPVHPARLRAMQEAEESETDDMPVRNDIVARIIPSLQRDLRGLMAEAELEALVFATMSSPATAHEDVSDASQQRDGVCDPYRAVYIAPAVGFPEITVPVGRVSANRPVGYSVLGLPGSEARLLGLAHALQISGPPWSPPQSLAAMPDVTF